MNIVITPQEATEAGVWVELCKMKGINIWLNDDPIKLTLEEARQLGLWIE